jgi:predicted DNA-binding protein with PD1-like motif
MKYLKNGNKYVVRIDKGEEVIEQIRKVCSQNNIKAGSINGLGATDKVKVGLYNTKTKEYSSKELVGSFEIVSLIGNISRMNNEVYLHIHIGVSDEDMNLYGGHLNYCYISATCELVIDEFYLDVDRKYNEQIGLNLYEL